MRLVFPVTFIFFIFFSCEETAEKYADTIEVEITEENKRLRAFKMTIDSVLQADYPDDFEFYARHWQGPVQLDTSEKRAEDFGSGYQGEFSYYPLPASGKLYKAELNDFMDSPHPTDPEAEEYVVLLELSPLMGGGGFYLLVFEGDGFGNGFITSTYFACQMVDSISFRDMTYDWTQQDEIQVWYDQSPSVYPNKGFVQFRLEDDELIQVFHTPTFQSSYESDSGHERYSYAVNYWNDVWFEDTDGDGFFEIVVHSKIERVQYDLTDTTDAGSSEMIEESQRVHHWFFPMSAYKTPEETVISAKL